MAVEESWYLKKCSATGAIGGELGPSKSSKRRVPVVDACHGDTLRSSSLRMVVYGGYGRSTVHEMRGFAIPGLDDVISRIGTPSCRSRLTYSPKILPRTIQQRLFNVISNVSPHICIHL